VSTARPTVLAFEGRSRDRSDGWSDEGDGDWSGPEPPLADTPMYLAHHWPEEYERCAVVGGMHVCRRCLVLYPLAIVTALAVSTGSWWPHHLDAWALWLLLFAGTVEFVADNLRLVRYSAVRQAALSAPGSVAAGIGYVRYLHDTTDPLVWSVVAAYATACVAAVVVRAVLRRRSSR